MKITEIAILAALYIITARIGQVIATPPGNVTPIWIPSGIVLSVLLLRGNYLWPGIFIGALVDNVWAYIDLDNFTNLSESLFSGVCNGLGDSLGAMVAANYISKKIGQEKIFFNGLNVAKFVLFGAFLNGAISAIWGVSGLAVSGFITWGSYLYVWGMWWIGDAMGVILITPFLVMWRLWFDWSWLNPCKLLELLTFVCVLFVIGFLVFDQIKTAFEASILLWVFLPISTWSTNRFKLHITLVTVLVIAFMAIWLTVLGGGSIFGNNFSKVIIELQLFLFIVSITIYVLLANKILQTETQRALSESLRYNRDLFDLAAEGIITTDKYGSIFSFNHAAERLFGYEANEVIGKNVNILVNTEHRNKHDKYLNSYHLSHQSEIIGAGRDVIGLHKDGRPIELTISISESCYGGDTHFMAMMHDNSHVKSERRLLEDREKSFRFLANSSFEAIVIHDKGIILHANNRFFEMFQYEASELIGKPVMTNLLTPESMRVTQQYIAEGKTDAYEVICVRKDQSTFPAETMSRHDILNGIAVKIVAIRDITESKRQQVILSKAKESADAANRAKSDFIASMSHELRTPLNSIIGFSQLIQMDESSTKQITENAIEIIEAGKHLLNLINDILSFAHIDSGKLEIRLEVTYVSDLINECLSLISNSAENRKLTVEFKEEVAEYVNVDKLRLKQILLNILSNAVKYNREGGRIVVSMGLTDNNFVEIKISDTGIGLTKEQVSDLFTPFNRLGQEGGVIQGTGIGLVITKELINKMGGYIYVKSEKEVGSEFCVAFPRQEKGSVPIIKIQKSEKIITRKDENFIQILCIEDSISNPNVMEKMLKRKGGVILVSTGNAEDAIVILKSYRPDIILLDFDLPGMSGYEFMSHLREHSELKEISVIAVITQALRHDLEKTRQYHLSAYLTKPIIIGELFKAIDQSVASHEGLDEDKP